MVGHDIGHTIRLVGAVDGDDPDAEPLGVADGVLGDQAVTLDAVPLGLPGIADRP
jgi:hypothetical protein